MWHICRHPPECFLQTLARDTCLGLGLGGFDILDGAPRFFLTIIPLVTCCSEYNPSCFHPILEFKELMQKKKRMLKLFGVYARVYAAKI